MKPILHNRLLHRNLFSFLLFTVATFVLLLPVGLLMGQEEGERDEIRRERGEEAERDDIGREGGEEDRQGRQRQEHISRLRLAELLERAMHRNPDLRVAQANLHRVEAELHGAEAELNRARLQVTRQVISLHQELAKQRQLIAMKMEHAQMRQLELKRVNALVKTGTVSISKAIEKQVALDNLRTELLSIEAHTAEIQAELSYVLGRERYGDRDIEFGAMDEDVSGEFRYTDSREREPAGGEFVDEDEKGAQLDRAQANPDSLGIAGGGGFGDVAFDSPAKTKLRASLKEPTQIEFNDVPFTEAVEFLSELHGIKFLISDRYFEDNDLDADDLSLTLNMKDVPLLAALQAIEDKLPEVRFFLRDYGILVMPTVHFGNHGPPAFDGYGSSRKFGGGGFF